MKVVFYSYKKDDVFRSPPVDWLFDCIISDLTIGKIYDATPYVYELYIKHEKRYIIINDNNRTESYPAYLFTSIEEIRNNKLTEIGI